MICDCSNFGKILEGSTGHTSACNRLQRKAATEAAKPPKQKKPLNKVSDKMAAALVEYHKKRKLFLLEYPDCAVFPGQPATQCHHMKGRATIELLLDENFWLPVSDEGHRKIELNPIWARDKGYSVSRTQTEPHKI